MKIKKLFVITIVAVIFVLMLSSCVVNPKKNNTPNDSPSEVASFNGYDNDYTEEDNDYIYYIDAHGLYRESKADNSTQNLIDETFGCSLTMHGDFIYFVTNTKMFMVNKNGKNLCEIKKPNDIFGYLTVKCIENTLYATVTKENSTKIYSFDVKNNTNAPQIISTDVDVIPMPNGKKYFVLERGEDSRGVLYESNQDGTKKSKLLDGINSNYMLIEGKYIFYIDMDKQIYRCDINGKNQKLLYKSSDNNIRLLNYDNDYIYCLEADKETRVEGKLIRINSTSGEKQVLLSTSQSGIKSIDVINGWIYTTINGTMNRVKSDGTGEIQTSPF